MHSLATLVTLDQVGLQWRRGLFYFTSEKAWYRCTGSYVLLYLLCWNPSLSIAAKHQELCTGQVLFIFCRHISSPVCCSVVDAEKGIGFDTSIGVSASLFLVGCIGVG